MGLVETVVPDDQLTQAVRDELNLVLQGSPDAQRHLKNLFTHLTATSLAQSDATAQGIATLRTSAALEKAEVAVVLIDVTEPISEQDVRIIDLVLESGRALVLAFNKWDLLDDERRRYLEREIEQDLAHVAWAPRVNISARTGRHLEKLVPALEKALDSWDTRIPTGKFNAFLAELVAAHPHPVRGGKQPRILFGTQASTRPPTFVLFTTGFLDPAYRRYIIRRLREIWGFEGSPINLNMRIREKRQR
jgi:GTP-binding protein